MPSMYPVSDQHRFSLLVLAMFAMTAWDSSDSGSRQDPAHNLMPTLPGPRVLSIQQPWAWAIAAGHKRVENRSWSTRYRGVVFNLGLETAWKRCRTVLVSDGGGQMQPEAEPKADWARHALRINGLMDNQVRALRKRQVVGSFAAKARKGTYWGIRSQVADYHLTDALDCPPDKTLALANLQTRLKRLDRTTQERLINWGYAICDTAMRRWVALGTPKPAGFPSPAVGLR